MGSVRYKPVFVPFILLCMIFLSLADRSVSLSYLCSSVHLLFRLYPVADDAISGGKDGQESRAGKLATSTVSLHVVPAHVYP